MCNWIGSCGFLILAFLMASSLTQAGDKPTIGIDFTLTEKRFKDNLFDEEIEFIETSAKTTLFAFLENLRFVDFTEGPTDYTLRLDLNRQDPAKQSGVLMPTGFHISLSGLTEPVASVYFPFRESDSYRKDTGDGRVHHKVEDAQVVGER